MAIVQETSGDTVACDGCGRTDIALGIREYLVRDPNQGSTPRVMHFDTHCAETRGLLEGQPRTIAGWTPAAPTPGTATVESPRRSRRGR